MITWSDVAGEFGEEVAAHCPWFEWQYPVPGPNPLLPFQLFVVSDEYGMSVRLRDPFGTPIGQEFGWKWSTYPGEVIERRRGQRATQ